MGTVMPLRVASDGNLAVVLSRDSALARAATSLDVSKGGARSDGWSPAPTSVYAVTSNPSTTFEE
jgi:hypothetical protein